jgi:hypothetical protein
LGIGATCLYAHIRAKQEQKKWEKPENQEALNDHFENRMIIPRNGYHSVNLNDIPVEKRAAYMGVAKRNEIGYKMMPALGGVALIGTIALGIIL